VFCDDLFFFIDHQLDLDLVQKPRVLVELLPYFVTQVGVALSVPNIQRLPFEWQSSWLLLLILFQGHPHGSGLKNRTTGCWLVFNFLSLLILHQ
jgi:hypothetical protein